MIYARRFILDKLIHSSYLRNRDMRPPHMESNLYQYHLKQLMIDGYVVKTSLGYTLSTNGLQYADGHSEKLLDQRQQAKLITILVIKNELQEILLVPRGKQPFITMLNFPSGKIHPGEELLLATKRELNEKVGITEKIEFDIKANIHLSILANQSIISESYGFVMVATISQSNKGNIGTWLSEKALVDHTQHGKGNIMPGVAQIWVALKTDRLFTEIRVNI